MNAFVVAWGRALRSLMQGDLLWHLLWPTLLAFLLWGVALVFVWAESAVLILHFVQTWPLVGSWFAEGSAQAAFLMAFAHVMLIILCVPLSLLTAAVFIAVFALPLMLDRVAARDYPDVEKRRGGTQLGSVANALWAVLLFLVMALLSLPLWFIPGVGLVLSILLSGWLNQRCYRYDALMQHADRAELKYLPREHRASLFGLGAAAGALAFIPFVNFFVPALTGLAFVHYLLEALRVSRQQGLIIDVRPQ